MKIGTKYIIINKNIDKVENDLKKLSGNSGIDDINNNLEIFHGEVNDRFFNFCYYEYRIQEYIFQGELLEKDYNKTLIKINIILPSIIALFNILWTIFAIYLIIKYIIPKWSDYNMFLNIFFLILAFGYPIGNIISYVYRLKYLIMDFNLYDLGYYDKYINL